MKRYSFFDLSTGLLASHQYGTSDAADLALNTPPGHGVIDGHHDHLNKRVDITTGELVDYQRPAEEIAAQATIDRRSLALAQIAQLEASQHRASRELSLGRPGAFERLQAIDADIAKLRLDL
ncbi:MAG TPA: hypothetical protein VGL45_09935 [Bradyrhizobium sp.]|jgi:hypothetical protein